MFGSLGKTQNLKFKKRCRTSATKCSFFLPADFLMALDGQTFKNTWLFNDPAGLSKKMCAPLRRNARKNENQFLNGGVGKVSGAKHQKTDGFSIFLTKSIGIPYQSLGELTHTPALTKPKEIECDELWTASTDRSSTSLEDTAAGPCQTKPDLTESLTAVGRDIKVRADFHPWRRFMEKLWYRTNETPPYIYMIPNRNLKWLVEQNAYVKLFSSKSNTAPQWSAVFRRPRRSIIFDVFFVCFLNVLIVVSDSVTLNLSFVL